MRPNRSAEGAAQPARGASWALLGGAIVLPAVVFGLVSYWTSAPSTAPPATPTPATAAPTARQAPSQAPDATLEALKMHAQANPEDAAAWAVLARHYYRAGRFTDALPAFEKAAALTPKEAQLLADYADTLATVEGKRLTGRPAELIQQALAIDPDNIKALWLAGTAAFQSRDYEAATRHWQRLQGLLPEGSQEAATMAANIQQARTLASKQGGESVPPPQPSPAEGEGER